MDSQNFFIYLICGIIGMVIFAAIIYYVAIVPVIKEIKKVREDLEAYKNKK